LFRLEQTLRKPVNLRIEEKLLSQAELKRIIKTHFETSNFFGRGVDKGKKKQIKAKSMHFHKNFYSVGSLYCILTYTSYLF
jgi:hypothetical protein